jgi:Ca-activated chloride channel homolog
MVFPHCNHRIVTLLAIPVILFSLLYPAGWAQQQAAPTSGEVYRSNAVILVHSDLVLIPVTVTDRGGNAVAGLEKQHFTLLEDSAPQNIIHFSAEDAPATIGIVFDTSGSMRAKMPKASEAVNTLLNNANPGDEFFFVTFSTEARLAVPLTNRVEDIRNRLESIRTTGTTAILDAVHLAISEMDKAHNTRKAIVIVSDGEDNASSWTVGELKKAVRDREIVVYAMGLLTGPGERSECRPGLSCGGSLLRDISRQTGGRMFEINRMQQLPEIAAMISGWLRHQYVLGYVPTHTEKDGAYRKIELKVERPKGYPRMHAVWRQGYYAPKE